MTGFSLPIELIAAVVAGLVSAIGVLWHRVNKKEDDHATVMKARIERDEAREKEWRVETLTREREHDECVKELTNRLFELSERTLVSSEQSTSAMRELQNGFDLYEKLGSIQGSGKPEV